MLGINFLLKLLVKDSRTFYIENHCSTIISFYITYFVIPNYFVLDSDQLISVTTKSAGYSKRRNCGDITTKNVDIAFKHMRNTLSTHKCNVYGCAHMFLFTIVAFNRSSSLLLLLLVIGLLVINLERDWLSGNALVTINGLLHSTLLCCDPSVSHRLLCPYKVIWKLRSSSVLPEVKKLSSSRRMGASFIQYV